MKNKEKINEAELNEDILEESLEDAEIKEDEEFETLSQDEVIKEMLNSNKRLEDENTKLNNEIDALKDRLLRITAEYENFRKRTAKEKEGIYADACEDVLKFMFPVLDNLERAVTVEGSVDDIKKGVEMTIRAFNDAFEKLNIEEIPTNEGFDPHMHNAVMHIEDDAFGTNAVAEVFQKGYKKGDKVLRYSMVKVAN